MNIPIKNITDVPTPTANTAYIFVDKSDNNLKIKKQSEVVTYIPGEDTSDATVTVNDVLSPKIFYGKDGKQVGAIPTVTPTKTDTLLSIPSGFLQKPYTLTLENSTDLSFVTATSETILKDYVSVDEYGNQITGTIPTVTPTLEENTFTVSKGYVESDTTLSIKRCSVESENNTVILETGFYTAQTLTIGTAKAAETYIPTTNDQIIDSNLFLTGQQIIKGDTNLISENIIKGKTIFGVDGAANTQETFYKCAEVIEATVGGYIVSNCGNVELNGTYTVESTNAEYTVYKNEHSATLYVYNEASMPPYFMKPNPENSDSPEYQMPVWQANSWGGINNSDITSVSWNNFSGGISPAPSISQLAGELSWNGYLANTDEEGNWTYSSDLTTDLTYSTITPEVGKIYNEDATIVINPESGSTDLSFITAGAGQILQGYIGSDKDGNQITGEIATRSADDIRFIAGTVDLIAGYYHAMSVEIPAGEVTFSGNVVTVKSGWVSDNTFEVDTAGGTDLSFVTAGANQILSGYVGADTDGNPVSGTITVKSSEDVMIIGGTVDISPGYYNGVSKSIPAGNVSINNNIVTVSEGYVYDKTLEVGTPINGGTLIPTTYDMAYPAYSFLTDGLIIKGDENLKSENIVSGISIFGVAGSHECPENSGSSMEIYKCVDAEGLTWWIVSGCGTSEANGRYYQGAEVFDTYNMQFVRPFYQKDGNCSIEYKDGCWQVCSGSTTLYRDGSWSFYDGDPSQCTSWAADSGVEPVPTITTETTTGNGWSGLKYDTENYTVADTITELTYKYDIPQIGEFYIADGSMQCFVHAPNLIVYAPLHERTDTTETGETISYSGNSSNFAIVDGVSCLQCTGNNVNVSSNDSVSQSYTVSCLAKMTAVEAGGDSFFLFIGGSYAGLGIRVKQNGTGVYAQGVKNGGSSAGDVYFTDNALGAFHHFTLTYKDKKLTVFFDGNKAGEIVLSTSLTFTTNSMEIAYGRGANQWHNGYIAEVKVWDTALRPEEIKAEADRCLAMIDNSGSDSVYGSKLQFVSTIDNKIYDGIYILQDQTKTGTDRVWVNESNPSYVLQYGPMPVWYIGMAGSPVFGKTEASDDPWDGAWTDGTLTVIDTASEQNPDLGGDDAGGSPTITFDGIYDSSGNKVDTVTLKYGSSASYTLRATASNNSTCTFYNEILASASPPGITIGSDGTISGTLDISYDNTQTYQFKISADGCEDLTVDIPFVFQSCVHPESLVMMADGTEKAIKDIEVGESVMSINQETGVFEPDIVLKNEYAEQCIYPVQDKWTFSDGTELITLARHRIFNVERKAFVYMDEWTIGEHARKADGSTVELVAHEVINEPEIMCTIRLKNNTYVVNGLLTGTRNAKALTPFEEVE